MSGETEIQTALFSALTGDAPFLALVAAVYDIAPEVSVGVSDLAFPYVTFGEIVTSPYDTQSSIGLSAVVRVHTYSASGSLLEARAIQAALYRVLHRRPLAVAGYTCTRCAREGSECGRGKDDIIKGVCEFRIVIDKSKEF